MLWFKLLVLAAMAAVLYSLFSALIHLLKDKGGSRRMTKSLAWRIGISIGLFILLFSAYLLGWISPHPIAPVPNG